jgi:hypothetical protein
MCFYSIYILPTAALNKLGNVRTADIVVRYLNILLFNFVEKKILLLEFKERILKTEY